MKMPADEFLPALLYSEIAKSYISSSSLPYVSLMNLATKNMLKMAKNE